MPLPGLHGRVDELSWLRGLWDACTERDPVTSRFTGGPRAAFIIAESGIGKSRLVQALYQHLTTDPEWDPPEVDYWPDAFHDLGVQLRVVPDMSGHVAQGPPRFAWLGVRWQPTDVRNVSDRRSALPELRQSIMVHAEILRRQGSLWQDASGRIREAIRQDGLGEIIEQVADSAVPFGGLLAKLAKGALDLAKDRMNGPRTTGQEQDAKHETLIDETCACLRALMDGPGGLPTILWLDDAQWIDAGTQDFLRRIWPMAKEGAWPLMVVVTHWEREWRELKHATLRSSSPEGGPPDDLCWLEGEPGVELRILQPSPPDALSQYLGSRLTGLTPAQHQLVLDKAAGNFLTLVENVGQLTRVPQNFLDRDVSKALTAAGERKVSEWESDRQKRVEQRFTELAPELQDMLGWGSHLGVSFLCEVVEEYAERAAGLRGAPERLREAVDPLVILGEPSEHLREFRDRAFHHVARRHFDDYAREHAEALDTVLRERLIEWVNGSFDDDGEALWPNEERGMEAPKRSVVALTHEEARDVLGMAMRCLPLPASADWQSPANVAALRARVLLVAVDRRDNLWERVLGQCRELGAVQWTCVDSHVLSQSGLEVLAETAWDAGATDIALSMAQVLLDCTRDRVETMAFPGNLSGLRASLDFMASLEQAMGLLDGALAKYRESLEIARTLAESLATPESQREVCISLNNLAYAQEAHRHLDQALVSYTESLALARRCDEVVGTTESRRDVAIGLLGVARIEHARRHWERAEACYKEAYQLLLALAKSLGTAQSRQDLSISLNCLARLTNDAPSTPGDMRQSAQRWLEESSTIRRELADSLGTPQAQRDVCWNLDYGAKLELASGNWKAALALRQESLAIRRTLVESIGTPNTRYGLANSLAQVASIEWEHGDAEAAMALEREAAELLISVHNRLRSAESHRRLYGQLDDLIRWKCTLADRNWWRETFAAALRRLDAVLPWAEELEHTTDAGQQSMLADYWMHRARLLGALIRDADATACQARAAKIRSRIKAMPRRR